mmetsp:Transcript_4499/g.6866  ORF Transcript_4499/g.6866 Transcript_4499/m.6866 type:complete len:82 (+) Transcript_4499:902-1147(+)
MSPATTTEATGRGTSMVRGAKYGIIGATSQGHPPQERYHESIRMETLATWLLQQQTMRWLIRNGKRTSIIMQFQTKASLEV